MNDQDFNNENSEPKNIEKVDIRSEMSKSYLDYAMSVIVGRAIPDVRDGLKPVHRRVIYAMYSGGYRPDKAFSKCSRVVGDVMGKYHPHGDMAIYDTLVRLVQPWSMRHPLALGQGNFGSAGNDGAASARYTETKMAPIALEMVRDIEEGTVDFVDNYDGQTKEPSILPSRFPNLLINGSEGIAVGMATKIPPHNLVEISNAVLWILQNPDATEEEQLEKTLEFIPGPDFPTAATILETEGIKEAYKTGRGSIIMRAVTDIEEIQDRVCIVVKELPYQVNPDNLATKIADLVKTGRISGIADIRDETSGRGGQRLVIVLKKDAVINVVLNNLYKHTQLQETFGANMLAIVDGKPQTLNILEFITLWIQHQINVIVRRTQHRLKKAEEDIHILRGYLKALDMLDEAIALIRKSSTIEDAKIGLMKLLEVDELQAIAILNLQLRRLAALERQKIIDEAKALEEQILEYGAILQSPQKQKSIIATELTEIVKKFGEKRKTKIIKNFNPSLNEEDFIPQEDEVVTITKDGYIKRTRSDNYRSQKRGGKGAKGTKLRLGDIVAHFFTTTTHHWILFFTNLGRVYRIKCYEIQEASRESKGQHIANLIPLMQGELIAGVMSLKNYTDFEYLILTTKKGYVKKSPLSLYDTNRQSGIVAIKLKEDDELISALAANAEDNIMLFTKNGKSLHFSSSNDQLRPLSRGTSGVRGILFRDDDFLLNACVVSSNLDESVFTITQKGYAKRTPVTKYRLQKRGGQGIKVMKVGQGRGPVVGAVLLKETDEVLVMLKSGRVIRTPVVGVSSHGRDTMGVRFVSLEKDDEVIGITKHFEESISI